jgi:hypothetical protein
MQDLNLRLNSASELTYSQLDLNFKRIKAAVDALEISVAGAGLGTVTSVGLSLPNIFTVTNSPVTTTGSLTATLVPQNGNLVFSSPNGTSGQPTFRSLVAGDLPNITIAKGGTGLTALPLNNQVLVSNGVGYEGRHISVGLGLTLTQGTGSINLQVDSSNINLTSLGGVLTSNQGGTGISSTPANGELLIGNGTVWQKATLTAGSGINITNGAGSITISTSASGVSALNGLGGVLALGVGTTGTDVNVTTPTANDIRINIPTASATNRGVLTAADWFEFKNKLNNGLQSGSIFVGNGSNVAQGNPLTLSNTGGTFGLSNTGVLTMPNASSSIRGLLTSTDWTTFNGKVGGSGTTDYIPKFTASGTVGNSVLYDTGARIGINTAIPQYELDVFPLTGGGADSSLRVRTNTGGFRAALRLEDGGNTTIFRSDGFLQSNAPFLIQGHLRIFPTGNVQVSKGFALNGLVYWDTASNYTFPISEQYGVILGPTSPATMTVTLPTSPMDGQEVCILTEENKTLTVSSGIVGRLIYGQAETPATSVTLAISLNTHGSAIIFKYADAGNAGVGAWYLTGF